MIAAARHTGMSVIEALQNCVIFNDKTTPTSPAADKARAGTRGDAAPRRENALGANNERASMFENMAFKVVTVGRDGCTLTMC